ncbi:MAG: protein translocase subunit SecD [Actinobacteria bacterium]|nr:protein translocase subunit SecD [Actinomycetota bacterium]
MRRKLIVSLVGIMVVAYGALLLTIITDSKPALGLDLQGGISVTQQPKPGTDYSDESLDLAVEKIRERVDSLGVAEPEILRQGDTIVVNLPGVQNQQQAVELVQVTGQVYLRPVLAQCQVLDTSPTSTTVAGSSTTSAATSTTAAGGPSRAVSAGNTTTTAATEPTTAATDTSTTVAGDTTTTVGIVPVAAPATSTTTPALDENGVPVQESDPNNNQLLPVFSSDPPEYCYVGPQQGTGEVFTNANAVIIPGKGWGVTVDLRGGAEGEDIWNNLARQCYNAEATCPTQQISIDLDGTLQSVATVQQEQFTGSVEISGSFSENEAKNLARVLNSGSLPVQLQLQSVQNVSPSLGKDSLRAAVISGLFGVLLVLIFMVAYYRLLGLIVAIGITVSGALLWGIITWLSTTNGLALSLAGIAGIIVSVGVTVDSYVVFFERLKDEVRSGKTMRNSAQRGFQGAWRTIVIADLVSLIGALVLWYLTVGAVRGFAFFLGLSTLCDLIVAYFFTRPMVLLLARTRWMERQKVMGIEVTATQGASS